MRADTKKKHKMGRRFTILILIGVAAAGVMALGAQTAATGSDVVRYDTKVTIRCDEGCFFHGSVSSDGGKKCEVGRRVTLFKQRPGADRKLGTVRSDPSGSWGMQVGRAQAGWRVYAEVSPKVGDGFVCSGDRSPIWSWPRIVRSPRDTVG